MNARSIRFLALGDSYTCGESVLPSERWTDQLAGLLSKHDYQVQDLRIIARTGWTTSELSQALQQASLLDSYDLVSLLIGVNNHYRGLKLDPYQAEFSALLKQAIEFAGGEPQRVMVLSIPDWGVTSFALGLNRQGISAEIDRFNTVNREEAWRFNAQYINITPFSRMAGDDVNLVAQDGLHPSGFMYAEWAQMALPAALSALENRTK